MSNELIIVFVFFGIVGLIQCALIGMIWSQNSIWYNKKKSDFSVFKTKQRKKRRDARLQRRQRKP